MSFRDIPGHVNDWVDARQESGFSNFQFVDDLRRRAYFTRNRTTRHLSVLMWPCAPHWRDACRMATLPIPE